MSQNPPLARHIVTAVIVAHDGARWLPDTLKAVLTQSRPPDRLVAADTGSRDHGPAVLDEVVGADHVATLARATGYGAAIAAALKLPAASAPVPGERGGPYGEAPVEWIWLLHDDCAPDPHACEQLLRTAEREPRAKVIGPKVRDWHDHRVLLEAGVTIDRAGRRETGLEPYEFDQGQRDGDRTVLAVGSAGMLVRRDIWDALGGFDPNLKLFRDDLDFCWRAGGAGHKVLLTTTAVVYHAEASARRRRRIAAGRGHPRRVDRRNALYVLFANLPTGALLVAMVRALFGSLVRTLVLLLAKQPGPALDELAAVGHVYGRPLRMLVARRRRARDRRRGYAAIRPYMARGLAAARLAAMIGGLFGGATPVGASGRHHAGAVDDDGEEDLLADTRGPLWRVFTHPGVLLFLALTLITVAAERSLLVPALTGKSGGLLGGGALVPVTGGASDLWRQYLAGWHPVGLGSADAAPPATAVIAGLATVLFGSVPAAVGLLLLGCVPLAGLVVYAATRHVVAYRPARVWLAASYALLPVATGAIAAGRLGTAVAIVVLPMIGVFFAKMLARHGAPARRAAWSAALLLAVAMAFVPLVWPLILVIGGLVAVAFGGGDRGAERRDGGGGRATGGGEDQRTLLVNVAIVVVTPPLLLGPWAWALFAHPSRFLLETGLARPGLADPALSARSLLLLSPGGPGVPPVWMTAGFLLAALAALCLRRHRVLVAAGWGVALFGLLVAILVSRATPVPSPGGAGVAAWPGVALGVAATGLLLAAATVAGTVLDLVRAGGMRRVAGLVVVALACSSPVLTAAAWLVRGADVPLTRTAHDVMPPAVAALSGHRTGTLVVRPSHGGVAYAVLRGRAPRFGEDRLRPPDAARRRLDALVSGLMSGRGGDDGNALAGYGIRFVLLPAPVDAGALHRLDGVPGMSRMTLTSDYAVWRVTRPTARLRVVTPSGAVTAVADDRSGVSGAHVGPGPSGRRLELAEPADGGWSATLNGHDLRPVTVNGWSQGFTLPETGGTLTVTRATFWHDTFLYAQAAALLAALALSLPARTTDQQPAPTPRPRPHRRPAALPPPAPPSAEPATAPEPAAPDAEHAPSGGEAPSGAEPVSPGVPPGPAAPQPASSGAGPGASGAQPGASFGAERAVFGSEAPATWPHPGGPASGGMPDVDRREARSRDAEGAARPSADGRGDTGRVLPGQGARGRPLPDDPLAGTPLSRATPLPATEAPTGPLPTRHPQAPTEGSRGGPLPLEPPRGEPAGREPVGEEPARDERPRGEPADREAVGGLGARGAPWRDEVRRDEPLAAETPAAETPAAETPAGEVPAGEVPFDGASRVETSPGTPTSAGAAGPGTSWFGEVEGAPGTPSGPMPEVPPADVADLATRDDSDDGWSWFAPVHRGESTRDTRTSSVADEKVSEDDEEPTKDVSPREEPTPTKPAQAGLAPSKPPAAKPAAGEPPAGAAAGERTADERAGEEPTADERAPSDPDASPPAVASPAAWVVSASEPAGAEEPREQDARGMDEGGAEEPVVGEPAGGGRDVADVRRPR